MSQASLQIFISYGESVINKFNKALFFAFEFLRWNDVIQRVIIY